MAAIGTETGEVVVETDMEAEEEVDVMEVVEVVVAGLEAVAMVAVVDLGEVVVLRASSPEEDSEPLTGPESVFNPSRRTFTTPQAPAGTWTPGTWPSSGEAKKYFVSYHDDKRSSQLTSNETKTPFQNY